VNLPHVQPLNPTRIAAPFNHPDFLFELKHDGFRAMAYITAGKCELVSGRNNTYKSFGQLRDALASVHLTDAILDGEIVCLDGKGRSIFKDVMHRKRRDAAFYAFDILWLDGQDLRSLGLIERKRILRRIVRASRLDCLLYADYVEVAGTGLFREVCGQDCEGIVAKHRLAPYSPTPQSWFKVLNPDYTQKRGRRGDVR
jgi:bifunctional non-homologous end joining protein LigD